MPKDTADPYGIDYLYEHFGNRIEMHRPKAGTEAPKAIDAHHRVAALVFGEHHWFRWLWLNHIILKDWWVGAYRKDSTINGRPSELRGEDKAGKYRKADWLETGEPGWARYVHIPTPHERQVVAGRGVPYKPIEERASPRRKADPFDRTDVPLAIRQLLCNAQGYRCVGCCRKYSDVRCFELDHVVSLVNDGKDELKNWQLLCPRCNRRKGPRNGPRHPNEWLWQRNADDVWQGEAWLLNKDFALAERLAHSAALCYKALPDTDKEATE